MIEPKAAATLGIIAQGRLRLGMGSEGEGPKGWSGGGREFLLASPVSPHPKVWLGKVQRCRTCGTSQRSITDD
jgi:hypothetical protein